MEDFSDTHICLACQTTIIGLDNYVLHRRAQCPSRKSPQSGGKTGSAAVGMSGAITQSQTAHSSSFDRNDNLQGNMPTYLQSNTNSSNCVQPGGTSLTVQPSIADTEGLVASVTSYLTPCPAPSNPALLQSSYLGMQMTNGSVPASQATRGPLTSSLAYSRTAPLQTSTQSHAQQQQSEPGIKLSPLRSAVGHLDLNLTSTNTHFDSGLSPLQIHDANSHHLEGQVTSHSQSENLIVSDPVASLVSTLSPSAARGVDPNMVLYGTSPNDRDTVINDFFSSLELQSRGGPDQGRSLGGDSEKNDPALHQKETLSLITKLDVDRLDHQKALRIASILDDLAFSSDSDNLLPSDTEHFLDSSDEDLCKPPRSHTGGKWHPGEQSHHPVGHTHGKWKPAGKKAIIPGDKRTQTAMQHHGGKLGTGGKKNPLPQRMPGKYGVGLGKGSKGGKYQPSEDDDDDDKGAVSDDEDDDDDDDEPPGETGRGKPIPGGKRFSYGKYIASKTKTSEKPSTTGRVYSYGKQIQMASSPTPSEGEARSYYCKFCERTLLNKVSYERHCTTNLHIRRSTGETDVTIKEESEEFECTVCDKKVINRYNFARHLVSALHQRKAMKGERAFLLDESYQLLLSRQSRFQCHVCHFYCHQADQLHQHLSSVGHSDLSEELLGPLLCVRCKFACYKNLEMITHIESAQHINIIMKSDRPCVIRESRFRVRCRLCSNTFHSATILKKHLETMHSENEQHGRYSRKGPSSKRPVCQYCKKSWPSFFAMEIHIRRKHTKERPFTCKECDCSYADKYSLTLHFRSKRHLNRAAELGDLRPPAARKAAARKHSTKQKVMHKCKACDFTAPKYSDLRPHFLQEHAEAVLECVTCGVQFVTQSAFTNHMSSKSHAATEEDAKHSKVNHTCPTCGKKYYNTKKFTLHTLLHQRLGNNTTNRTCYRMAGVSDRHQPFVDSLKGLSTSARVTCHICQQTLSRGQIFTHLRIHDGVSPFGCIYCARTFSCPIALRRHLSRHIGIKLLNCKVCKKKFSTERYLRVHVHNAHSPANEVCQHKCSVCDKVFRLPWQLKAHKLLHLKPVKCTYDGCKRNFKNPSELTIHMRVHTGERPYLCDQCGYSAATRHQLTRHRRSHTGERQYQCEYCSYRAINGTNLRRHMRIHTGTKPYKCPYCPYACNSHENLRKHVLRTKKHAGKPVYPCTICNMYGTNSAGDFKDHLVGVHNITEKDIDILSVYAGIYNKSGDIRDVPEGSCAIPCKERGSSTSEGYKRPKKAGRTKLNILNSDNHDNASSAPDAENMHRVKKRRMGVGQRLNNSDVEEVFSSDEEELNSYFTGEQRAFGNVRPVMKEEYPMETTGEVIGGYMAWVKEPHNAAVATDSTTNDKLNQEPLNLTSNVSPSEKQLDANTEYFT